MNTISFDLTTEPTIADVIEKQMAGWSREQKLYFLDGYAAAFRDGYFIFADGSELKAPIR